jgi:hypothetical protein
MKTLSKVFTFFWAAMCLVCVGAVISGATWHWATALISAVMALVFLDDWKAPLPPSRGEEPDYKDYKDFKDGK